MRKQQILKNKTRRPRIPSITYSQSIRTDTEWYHADLLNCCEQRNPSKVTTLNVRRNE